MKSVKLSICQSETIRAFYSFYFKSLIEEEEEEEMGEIYAIIQSSFITAPSGWVDVFP